MQSHDQERLKALGAFIRTQRQLGRLTLRQFANLARISNPYLSQVERGLYRPSAEMLKTIADVLNIPIEELYRRAGLLDEPEEGAETATVEQAIRLDPRLTAEQKAALLGVYRGFVGNADAEPGAAGPRLTGDDRRV